MVAVQNLKGEIIQLILPRKGGHVPCKIPKPGKYHDTGEIANTK
jgi:hypothetical protein